MHAIVGVLSVAFGFLVLPLALTGQISDTVPPTLAGFSFTPNAVDVTSGPQNVTVNFHVTDDLSGVLGSGGSFGTGIQVQFRSPTGIQFQFGSGMLLPGSLPLNANFQAVVRIPQYSESGDWTVQQVFLRDAAGNAVSFDTAMLASMSFPTVLKVTSIPDTTPPTLISASMTPASIDVSAGPLSVTVSLGVTDSVAGVFWVRLGFLGPSGQYLPERFLFSSSGTSKAGVWSTTFDFPRFAESGVWAINSLQLIDAANNRTSLSAAQIQALGFPAVVRVTSTPTDDIPPVLTSFTITPAVVNTATGPQTMNLNVGLTDNLSGVDFYHPSVPWFYFMFRSPSGLQFALPSTAFSLNSGTPLNGQWHTTLMLPQFSEGGSWRLQSVSMVDAALNQLNLNTAQLQALGLPTSFVVFQPSVTPDGIVDVTGGTVNDAVFGSRASVTFPPGAVSGATTVAIDVLSSALSVPAPAGFSTSAASFFTNIELNPQPAYPLPSPGLTLVLPLISPMPAGTVLSLYRLDPLSGLPVPAQDTSGLNIQGTVDASTLSAIFTGVSRLSIVVAYLPTSGTVFGDVNRDGKVDCTDVAIVKTAFGKRTGQPGFDTRADLNRNSVVDINDLAIVSRQLAAGTTCP